MRVVIVADHPLAAEAIRRGLRHAPACEVIGFVNGRTPCAAIVQEARADVVVLDEPADAATALERIGELRRAAPSAKLMLLSQRMEPGWLAEAAAAGIDAAIAKTDQLAGMGTLVREIAAGNVFHAFGRRPAPARQTLAADALTARELEILRLTAGGASNGSIASQLWVTEQTVKFHLSNVYRKLGLANRTEASHYAHVNGLLEQPAASLAVAA